MLVPYAEAAERDRIAQLLEIRKGAVVADVGAGKGEWTVDLARRVGKTGRVYSTEINPPRLTDIENAVAEAELENVTVITLPIGLSEPVTAQLSFQGRWSSWPGGLSK